MRRKGQSLLWSILVQWMNPGKGRFYNIWHDDAKDGDGDEVRDIDDEHDEDGVGGGWLWMGELFKMIKFILIELSRKSECGNSQ